MAVSEEIQRKVLAEATSATPNYDIDYNDKRFTGIEADRKQALSELEQTYAGMIGQVDDMFGAQMNANQEWADKQAQIQQDRTDFAIEQIEQQKDKANKDYLREQSGAYVDWRKQSNQYGAEAEKMASAGLDRTGFAESSQVSMYNTYQNRIATARESYNNAVLNYNNAIKDAMLQNNAALAEIAYQALQQQLELSLEGFQYKNQLIMDQAAKKTELDNMYWNRYQDVLDQINKENSLAEEVRQYNASMAEEIRQYNENMAWNTEQKALDREHSATQAQLDRNFKAQEAELDRAFQSKEAEIQRKYQTAQAELNRKHDKDMLAVKNQYEKERLAQQHANDMAKLKQQQQYELEQLNKQLANEKSLLSYKASLEKQSVGSIVKSGSGGSSSKSSSTHTSSSGKVHGGSSGSFANSSFTGSTYDQAISYLNKKGINGAGVMTQSEWSRRKSSYSMTGIGNAAVKNYSSYAAYLRDYVNYTATKK